MKRILLGGSPCTFWSIAQKNNRETEASGIGWELFKNYLIAKEKFKPDYSLYENNVSAAQPIKDQIKQELNVWDGTLLMPYTDVRYIEINSDLVSAQNRKRFYVHNCGEVGQPKDRGVLLKDILESGCDLTGNEKSFALTTRCNGAIPEDTLEKHRHTMVAEPVGVGYRNRREADGKLYRRFETSNEPKANAITTVQTDSMVAVPLQVGSMPRPNGELSTSQAFRVYDINAKSVTINSGGGGAGGKTGLYAVPLEQYNYATEFDSDGKPIKAYCYADGKIHTVYEVKGGKITIKGKEYPIKLNDGFYIIRKLTVAECRRLQTVPDWYKMPCSDTQNYKMLGNGWTIEVIKHILSHIPEIAKGEPIEVLSMYDGMSCGQIALKELGVNVVKYYATEIDKYAIQTTQANFPYTIQLGDAFQVRNANWTL